MLEAGNSSGSDLSASWDEAEANGGAGGLWLGAKDC